MKLKFWYKTLIIGIGLVLLSLPVAVVAQTGPEKAEPAPIAQQLVREGELAVILVTTFGLEATDDEVEAENRLSEVGIMPRNGWIADYPVTPDIVGELFKSVRESAEAGKLSIDRDEALKRFDSVIAGLNIAVKPHEAAKSYQPKLEISEAYPDPAVINDYYATEGPPVVTYYAPPPNYYYLYSWVPYPFWWTGIWFPGFFVLNDFHRTIVVDQRVFFVSNHFRDLRGHRAFRIDPYYRFRGRTFAGIGVTDRRGFISTGVPRSDRTIFNGPRTRSMDTGVRTLAPQSPRFERPAPSERRGSVIRSGPSGGSTIRSGPSSGGGSTPSRGSGGRRGSGSGRSHGGR